MTATAATAAPAAAPGAAAPRRAAEPPRIAQLLAAIPQLVLHGLFGGLLLMLWSSLVLLGVTLSFVLVGLPLLVALGFALTGGAWLEERRAAWTFALDVPPHPMRRSTRTDGWRPFHTAALQWADARSWLVLLHAAIVSVLGLVAVLVIGAMGGALTWVVAPFVDPDGPFRVLGLPMALPLASLFGVLLISLGAAVLLGLAAAHRALSVQLLVPDAAPALRAEAAAQGERRTQAMAAAEIERTRIERDLHDGVQPRLVSVAMTLGMAKRKL
ncbi:MAG: sensor histidine kinase, partial [Microbacteriaceae bacterium]|nr:sensor histidine kinase [Microbacteriaceae bacterium]